MSNTWENLWWDKSKQWEWWQFVDKLPQNEIKTKVEEIIIFSDDLEKEKFPFEKELLDSLNLWFVWQKEAKEALIKTIVTNLNSIRQKKWPFGVLFFSGPTWVWKTESVKALAKTLFWKHDAYTHISGEKFQEAHTISNLFWSPNWYIWYGDKLPFSPDLIFWPYNEARKKNNLHASINRFWNTNIILFDEVEKIHPNVIQSLLSILNEGFVEVKSSVWWNNRSAETIKVDLSNSIIIFTSNIAEKEKQELKSEKKVWFFIEPSSEKEKESDFKKIFKKSLNDKFSPEFLWRIDNFVEFKSLTKEEYREIIDLEVTLLNNVLKNNFWDTTLKIEDEVYDYFIDKYSSTEYGARDFVRNFKKDFEAKLNKIYSLEDFHNKSYEKQVDIIGFLDNSWNISFKFELFQTENKKEVLWNLIIQTELNTRNIYEEAFVQYYSSYLINLYQSFNNDFKKLETINFINKSLHLKELELIMYFKKYDLISEYDFFEDMNLKRQIYSRVFEKINNKDLYSIIEKLNLYLFYTEGSFILSELDYFIEILEDFLLFKISNTNSKKDSINSDKEEIVGLFLDFISNYKIFNGGMNEDHLTKEIELFLFLNTIKIIW